MEIEMLIDALDSVTWYNGLAEEIVKWKEPGYFDEEYGFLNWKWAKFCTFDPEFRAQIEIIWMICVILFGDYGTSPRSGWIEKKEEFYKFVDAITSTCREDLERMQK